MTIAERNDKLKHLITCMKCEVSGKVCDENCPTQYEAGNMGEIIENLEAISKALEQEPNTWSLDDARDDFKHDVYNTLAFLPTNEEANQIIDSFDRVTSSIEQEPILGKIRAEIAEYGSIMVAYAITKDTKTDKGIEKLVSDVLQQAKEEVLEIIDKYKAGSEDT